MKRMGQGGLQSNESSLPLTLEMPAGRYNKLDHGLLFPIKWTALILLAYRLYAGAYWYAADGVTLYLDISHTLPYIPLYFLLRHSAPASRLQRRARTHVNDNRFQSPPPPSWLNHSFNNP